MTTSNSKGFRIPNIEDFTQTGLLTNGDVISFNGTNQYWTNVAGAFTCSIASCTDVSYGKALAQNDILYFDLATAKWKNKVYNISTANDIGFAGLADKDKIYYDLATTQWKNKQSGLYDLENTTLNFICRNTRPASLNSAVADYNVLIGNNSGDTLTTGKNNIYIGTDAGNNCSDGSKSYNVGIGQNALKDAVNAYNSTAVGTGALSGAMQGNATAFGYMSLASNFNGNSNVAFGAQAGQYLTGASDSNTIIGAGALSNNSCTCSHTTVCGFQACGANAAKSDVCAFGYEACQAGSTGDVGVGFQALKLSTNGYNIGIGWNAGQSISTGTGETCIGTSAGNALSTAANDTFIGYNAGLTNNAANNVAIGSQCFNNSASENSVVAIGFQCAQNGKSGCTAIGCTALKASTGSSNTAIGNICMTSHANTGSYNVAIGASCYSVGVSGANNVAVGFASLNNCTANSNTAIGYEALLALTTGTLIDAFGYNCLSAGTLAGLTNITALGNSITIGSHSSNSVILGNSSQITYIDNTTEASNTTTASVVMLGGLACSKKIYCAEIHPTTVILHSDVATAYYGEMYGASPSHTILINPTTYYQMILSGAGALNGFTYASNELTATNTGTYKITASLSLSTSADDIFTIAFYIDTPNSGEIAISTQLIGMVVTGAYSISLSCITPLIATHKIGISLSSPSASNTQITVQYGEILAIQV